MSAVGKVVIGFSLPYVAKYSESDGVVTYSTLARFARELVKAGGKDRTAEQHAVEAARIHVVAHLVAAKEGRTDEVEGSCRSPALRQVRRLDEAGADVVYRAGNRRNVRRGIHEEQIGLVVVDRSSPALNGNHRNFASETVHSVQIGHQLADRQPVAGRNRAAADEGGILLLKDRALHAVTADHIDAVEDQNGHTEPTADLHEVVETPKVGVKPRADVLDVVAEEIDLAQHFLGLTVIPTVQIADSRAGHGLDLLHAVFAVLRAGANAMLGREEGGQASDLGNETVGRPPCLIDPRCGGQHADPLAAHLFFPKRLPVNAVFNRVSLLHAVFPRSVSFCTPIIPRTEPNCKTRNESSCKNRKISDVGGI